MFINTKQDTMHASVNTERDLKLGIPGDMNTAYSEVLKQFTLHYWQPAPSVANTNQHAAFYLQLQVF